MARRVCECGCGRSLEGRRPNARFYGDTCRKRLRRGLVPGSTSSEPASTAVATALRSELVELKVADTYEGQVALGIAEQLDGGAVVGAAYASLSKELDRRVDALRLKAERGEDPTKVIRGKLDEKRAALAQGA